WDERKAVMSPASRGRGLKRGGQGSEGGYAPSPASRGRGLKHTTTLMGVQSIASPASRGRGLKHASAWPSNREKVSPASRGRGLKHGVEAAAQAARGVARFTRAWIETSPIARFPRRSRVARF